MQSAQAGNATVSGRVLTPEDEPLSGARVVLRRSGTSASIRETFTDGSGRYSFPRIPAGTYEIQASLAPWLTAQFGQKRPGRDGTAIAVIENQVRDDVSIRLFRGAVIAGRITDENGRGLAGVLTQAWRVKHSADGRVMEQAAISTTNDRGEYRVFSLIAGEYTVRAIPPGSDGVISAGVLEGVQPARPAGRVKMFYPGVTSATQAGIFRLELGEERLATDLVLTSVPLGVVRGQLLGPAGPVTNGQFSVIDDSELIRGGDRLAADVGADGRFVVANVPAGPMTLQVRAVFGSGELWGSARVVVDPGRTVEPTIPMRPGASLVGKVQLVDGSLPTTLAEVKIGIGAAPAGPTPLPGGEILVGYVDSKGQFAIAGLPDGYYHLWLVSSSKWSVASVTIGGRTVTTNALQVSGEDVRDVVVALTDRPASLSGEISAPSGSSASDYTVVVFPVAMRPQDLARGRLYAVQPTESWRFTFPYVLPGEYFVVAAQDVELDSWFDPRVRDALAAQAMRVSIGIGERKIQNLAIRPK